MTDLSVSVSRFSPHQECALHPSFKWKPVYNLECVFCQSTLCVRGMKAILLADTRVELYSTDLPPSGATVLVEEDYETRHCECRIKDIACALCGNIVGYHVMLPCHPCLKSCNNGHFWMFHSACVQPHERLDHNLFCYGGAYPHLPKTIRCTQTTTYNGLSAAGSSTAFKVATCTEQLKNLHMKSSSDNFVK